MTTSSRTQNLDDRSVIGRHFSGKPNEIKPRSLAHHMHLISGMTNKPAIPANRYATKCACCGAPVAAWAGELHREGKTWFVQCRDACPVVPVVAAAPAHSYNDSFCRVCGDEGCYAAR